MWLLRGKRSHHGERRRRGTNNMGANKWKIKEMVEEGYLKPVIDFNDLGSGEK